MSHIVFSTLTSAGILLILFGAGQAPQSSSTWQLSRQRRFSKGLCRLSPPIPGRLLRPSNPPPNASISTTV